MIDASLLSPSCYGSGGGGETVGADKTTSLVFLFLNSDALEVGGMLLFTIRILLAVECNFVVMNVLFAFEFVSIGMTYLLVWTIDGLPLISFLILVSSVSVYNTGE